MFGDPLRNTLCWPTKKMSEVAPPSTYDGDVDIVDGKSWLLNLDAIESHSRRLCDKAMTPIGDIGPSTFKFSTRNVLYSKLRPYLNKLYIPTEPGYATTELVPLTPDSCFLDPVFLASLIQGKEFLSFIETQVSGTKMPRVQMNVFWDFNVILPPLPLQQKFVSFVEQSDKSKFAVQFCSNRNLSIPILKIPDISRKIAVSTLRFRLISLVFALIRQNKGKLFFFTRRPLCPAVLRKSVLLPLSRVRRSAILQARTDRKTCLPSMIPLIPSSGRALQGKAGRSLGASALRENVSRQGN